jgi:uncharacterized protein (TIGR03000 family)
VASAPVDTTATLVVNLPADAKLTVDDHPTTSTSARRVFTTPALRQGDEYYYNLKAQVERDGKTVTLGKQAIVRAGQQTEVSFDFAGTKVAQQ